MNQTSPKSQIRKIITLVKGLSHVFGRLKTRWVIHRIRLSYEQYRRIERGVLLVKTEHINAIVQALDVTADYILYGDTSQMKHESISKILNGLSKEELERAERILLAAFK